MRTPDLAQRIAALEAQLAEYRREQKVDAQEAWERYQQLRAEFVTAAERKQPPAPLVRTFRAHERA